MFINYIVNYCIGKMRVGGVGMIGGIRTIGGIG